MLRFTKTSQLSLLKSPVLCTVLYWVLFRQEFFFFLPFLLLQTQGCLSPCADSLLKLSKLIPGKQERRSYFTEIRREWGVVRKCIPAQAACRLAERWRKKERSGLANWNHWAEGGRLGKEAFQGAIIWGGELKSAKKEGESVWEGWKRGFSSGLSRARMKGGDGPGTNTERDQATGWSLPGRARNNAQE